MIKKFITITGPDGSGKSTLMERLCKTNPNFREVSIWDAMQGGLFSSKQAIDDYLCSLDANARVLFLAHALKQSLFLAKDHEILLLNGYYYKYFATELALGASVELVDDLITFFPPSDLVIRLNIPSEVSFDRKQKLSKYECGAREATKENFIDFQLRTQEHWKNFDQNNWVEIDGTLDRDEVYRLAFDSIQNPLK